jgi:intracellular multiplication protein IcmB
MEAIFRDISDLSGAGVAKLCDLQTVINEYSNEDDLETLHQDIFSLNDGSLATLIRVRGHRKMVGHEEFVSGLNGLTGGFTGSFKESGHSLIVHYRYDPFDKTVANRSVAGMKKTAANFNLDLGDVVEDWGDAIKAYTRGESMIIVAVTRLNILQRDMRRSVKKSMQKANVANPFLGELGESQRIFNYASALIDQHKAFVDGLMKTMDSPIVSVVAEIINAREGLWLMRSQLCPSKTGADWSPVLPGDRLPMRLKDTTKGFKPKPFAYPPLINQLFDNDREMVDSTTVRWGDVYHRAVVVTTPPLGDTSFARLFERMTSPHYAWNMTFHIDGDGLSSISFKTMVATLLKPLSATNRQIYRAESWLKELSEVNDEAIVRLRMTLRLESKSLSILDQATKEMIAALQSWQSCEAIVPLGVVQSMACASTVPGLLSKSPAPAAAAPLRDVVSMLPWTRPAEIWGSGMLFRTSDGKAFPWLQGSSKQSAFIDIGLGPMGTGKSVNLNAINFGFLLTPGLTRLPMLSIVDIGPSSLGLVMTIQDALPPELKYLATYVRLRMEPERYSINIFDLPIGGEYPFPSHEAFLVNFLVLLQTPIGTSSDTPRPPEYAMGLSRAIIKLAYEHYSENKRPKLYQVRQDIGSVDCMHVDNMIVEMGFHLNEHTSWHEIVRMFFDKNMIREAEIAQRYAVPTLGDVLAFANDMSIRQIYGNDEVSHYLRAAMDAIAAYPIIKNPTRFSISEAKVVSLDLDDVATKGSPIADRQAGVIFMLVRYLLISRFFVQDDDVLMLPSHYQAYHRQRVDHIRTDPKRIVFDEVHRFIKKDNPVVSGQVLSDLNTINRESRKWNIHIGLYTQEPTDIPEDIAGLSMSTFVMGVNGSESTARRADDLFSFGETARIAMLRDLKKPGRSGSHMIARFVVDGMPVIRHLQNTLGPILLWALSSTTEDSRMRNRLYEVYGGRITRKALAMMYPGGTIKDLLEKMRAEQGEGRFISNEDREIYERLSRGQSEPVDMLTVIQHKVISFIERQRLKSPNDWI